VHTQIFVLYRTLLCAHTTIYVLYRTLLCAHTNIYILYRTLLCAHTNIFVLYRTLLCAHTNIYVLYRTLLCAHTNIYVLYRTLLCAHTIVCMLEKKVKGPSLHTFTRYKIPLLIACFLADSMTFTEVWWSNDPNICSLIWTDTNPIATDVFIIHCIRWMDSGLSLFLKRRIMKYLSQ
jgi:hypothetical protein